MAREPLLSAKDIEIEFSLRGKTLKAIRRCSLDLYEGETLAIVGESGSGKSVFTKSFLGMLDANGRITGGSIRGWTSPSIRRRRNGWASGARRSPWSCRTL